MCGVGVWCIGATRGRVRHMGVCVAAETEAGRPSQAKDNAVCVSGLCVCVWTAVCVCVCLGGGGNACGVWAETQASCHSQAKDNTVCVCACVCMCACARVCACGVGRVSVCWWGGGGARQCVACL